MGTLCTLFPPVALNQWASHAIATAHFLTAWLRAYFLTFPFLSVRQSGYLWRSNIAMNFLFYSFFPQEVESVSSPLNLG